MNRSAATAVRAAAAVVAVATRRASLAPATLAVLVAASLPACGAHGAGAASPAPPPVTPSASPSAVASASPTASTGAGSLAPAGLAADAGALSALPPVPPLAPAPAPKSTVASTKADDAWAACHRRFKPTAHDVSSDVAALARACEKPTKMKLLGKTLTSRQADQDKPQAYPLDAKAGHCYRVYAQAEAGIHDLDVAVRDSAGVVVGHDATHDASPVVPDDGAVCFRQDDKASVVVSVGLGSGAYALQIWED